VDASVPAPFGVYQAAIGVSEGLGMIEIQAILKLWLPGSKSAIIFRGYIGGRGKQ